MEKLSLKAHVNSNIMFLLTFHGASNNLQGLGHLVNYPLVNYLKYALGLAFFFWGFFVLLNNIKMIFFSIHTENSLLR